LVVVLVILGQLLQSVVEFQYLETKAPFLHGCHTTLQPMSGECAAVRAFLAHCHVDQFSRFLFKKCQRRINGVVACRRGMLTDVRSEMKLTVKIRMSVENLIAQGLNRTEPHYKFSLISIHTLYMLAQFGKGRVVL